MLALCLAAIMSLPIYPLNPTKTDTLNAMNFHVTAGINGPGKILSAGPEISAKFEFLLYHPFVLRGSFDYRYGKINSIVFPDGYVNRGTFAGEAFYYRGTDKLTGYFGAGLIYSLNSFNIDDDEFMILNDTTGVDEVDISSAIGYRLTAGLRLHRIYSLEISITELSPKFVYIKRYSSNSYSVFENKFRFNDFKFSLGYLFTLKI